MENILRPAGVNTGGVNPVQFVFADEVKSLVVSEDLLATIVLNSGKSWKYIYATDGSIVLDTKEEDTLSGTKYTYQVDMLVPKDQVDVEVALMSMNNRGVILLAKNKNGTVRIFGEPANPMRKKGKLSWPAEVEGYNGTKLSFIGEFSSPAAYIPSLNSEIPFAIPAES